MPKPYSNDLRRKVVKAIALNGMRRCEAHEHFNVSRMTINDWLKLYEEADAQIGSYISIYTYTIT